VRRAATPPEPACLRLANTLISDRPGRDLLADPASLRAWLSAEGVGPAGVAVEPFAELRRAVRGLLQSAAEDRAPAEADLRVVNRFAATGLRWPTLRRDGAATVGDQSGQGSAADQLLGEAARSAIELLTGPDRDRVGACAGAGCRLLFVAAHPGRRWCSSATCGNRARVARHRGAGG